MENIMHWEYMSIELDTTGNNKPNHVVELNMMGQAGWEVCGLIVSEHGCSVEYLLKRNKYDSNIISLGQCPNCNAQVEIVDDRVIYHYVDNKVFKGICEGSGCDPYYAY